ncbi:MAG: glycosyltransferase family 4 protein [Deltaproteobacteria bacterium]|jgi:glycosyltransferase involved in cell wall biosynthesis|nr:glycosyltransferase family 4 protein [Deltaproteobacteria bacterium]MBW2533879.1 glycosyltransferase family 4 protein [Deltaproteobacteria bacterium]
MKIGALSTRLAGTDGVSLETAKWADVLERMGHQIFYCAGELDESSRTGRCIPPMHFRDPAAAAVGRRAFESTQELDRPLDEEIERLAQPLLREMERFVADHHIDLLLVENALAIPMHLPLGKALADLIVRTGLPTVAHHHDFFWERERFASSRVESFLKAHFPFDAPNVRHVVIHSKAGEDLAARRGLGSSVVPNVFDFATPPPGMDDFNGDFRRALALGDDQLLVLQPTRVVPRKGIELAIELLRRLGRSDAVLVITHEAGDEGLDYLRRLERQAAAAEVNLRYCPELIGPLRQQHADGRKTYALWDAYPHADLVTYPSSYEGFGNALLEAVYFRCLVVVNRYSVYARDIAPTGLRLVELDGAVTDQAVAEVRALLAEPSAAKRRASHNTRVAEEHFSYEVLEHKLHELLHSF